MKKGRLIAIAAIAVIVICVAVFAVIPNAQNNAMYSKAQKAIEEKRFEEAAELYAQLEARGYQIGSKDWDPVQMRVAEIKEQQGDWEGAMEIYSSLNARYAKSRWYRGTDYAGAYQQIAARKAYAIEAEGNPEGAMAYVDSLLSDPPEILKGDYLIRLRSAKATLLTHTSRFDEADAVYQEILSSNSYYLTPVAEEYAAFTSAWLKHLSGQGDADGIAKVLKQIRTTRARMNKEYISIYNAGRDEDESLRNAILGGARDEIEYGALLDSAKSVGKLLETFDGIDPMKSSLEECRQTVIDAFIKDHRWDEFYQSPFRKDFETAAHGDRDLLRAYGLAATGRGSMADTDTPFSVLVDSLPDDPALTAEVVLRELSFTTGNARENYAAADAYCREKEIEAGFLSKGMDIRAGAEADGISAANFTDEMLAMLPEAYEAPGESTASGYSDSVFVKNYGNAEEFRAKEPRPTYYAAVQENGRAGAFSRAIMSALGEYEGVKTEYRNVSNPHCAAYLLLYHSEYYEAGTYSLRPTGGGDAKEYTGYKERIDYRVLDTATGEQILSGSASAVLDAPGSGGAVPVLSVTIEPGMRDDTAMTFRIPLEEKDFHPPAAEKKALRENTEQKIREFCGAE